jgi:DNA-binding helix-hairpin-helix protein with protein kinase domain
MGTSDKLRLNSDHMQTSSQRLGKQDGGLRPCSVSKEHPHRPENEDCGWCEPDTRSWYEKFGTGMYYTDEIDTMFLWPG